MQHASTRQAALGTFGPVADRPKGRFNRITGPNALPVLCRKIIESHQLLSVFVQADSSLRILRLIRLNEQVESFFCIRRGLSLPDFGLLETGRIDTISNQITMTDERKAKYLFADPYVVDGAQITVRKGNDSIKGVDDLAGKTVAVNLGSNFEQLLRQYDKDGKINIKTYDTGIEHDVALGRADAFVMDRLSALELIKKTGLPLELAGEPFETIQNAWPFVDNEKGRKLQEEVNKALAEMRADGTVEKISVKWFGADITK